MQLTSAPAYTKGEEWANSLTHGVGVLLSLAGLALLVTRSVELGDGWRLVSTAIYGATLVALYTSSTLYHALPGEAAKRLLRKFDHAAIFLLIAGTYTPFMLTLRGVWGWSMLGVVWALAVAGIVLKFWFTGRFRLVSTLLYVGLGWMIVLLVRPLLETVRPAGLWFLLAGGLCYTGGTVFYLWKKLPYHHAVWHGFVLAGSLCHFGAVFYGLL